jgi:polysaccharide export outer membrane protein
MLRRKQLVVRCLFARRRARRRSAIGCSRTSSRVNLIAWLWLAGVLAGCRGGAYTASTLPLEMQAAPLPPNSSLNLEQLSAAGVGSSQIGPGDLVQITIVSGSGEEKVTPVPARVGADGTVLVPLIGPVAVAGMEPIAAEQCITAAAVERKIFVQPQVTLTVTKQAVNRVTVLGAVAKPGVVELPRGSSDLASALAAAGGLAKEAGTRVEILHRGSPTYAAKQRAARDGDKSGEVNLVSFTDARNPAFAPPELVPPGADQESTSLSTTPSSGDVTRIDLAQGGSSALESRTLEDSDVVMVLPDDKRLIHVTGLVRKPDQFELPRDKEIRLLDALAMAGGTSSPVADKVFVIRQMPNMREPAIIKLSMADAMHNGDENLRLTAGDLVSVESTMSTMMVDTVGKFFRMAVGLNSSVVAF